MWLYVAGAPLILKPFRPAKHFAKGGSIVGYLGQPPKKRVMSMATDRSLFYHSEKWRRKENPEKLTPATPPRTGWKKKWEFQNEGRSRDANNTRPHGSVAGEKIEKVTRELHAVAERRSAKRMARHGVTAGIHVLTWSTHVPNSRGSHLEG